MATWNKMLVQSNLQLKVLPKTLHYVRRRPETTVLYQIIQNYWLTFIDKVAYSLSSPFKGCEAENLPVEDSIVRQAVIDEKGLPVYVKTEFEEFTLRV